MGEKIQLEKDSTIHLFSALISRYVERNNEQGTAKPKLSKPNCHKARLNSNLNVSKVKLSPVKVNRLKVNLASPEAQDIRGYLHGENDLYQQNILFK